MPVRTFRRFVGILIPVLVIMALTPPDTATGSATDCIAFEVQTGEQGRQFTLMRVDLHSGTAVPLHGLDYEVNAIGYARSQDLVYGIGNGGHVITIDRAGTVADRGPVRGVPLGELASATAGAAAADKLYVRVDDRLSTIDIAPKSPTYLGVVHTARMRPAPAAQGVDDFAVDDTDGLLYGVSTSLGSAAAIVSIDPASGAVRVGDSAGLPRRSSYGSAVLDSGRTLYVIINEFDRRSRLYAVPHGGTATEVASWPAAKTTDAAGCLNQPTPAPTPTVPAPPRAEHPQRSAAPALPPPAPVPARPTLPPAANPVLPAPPAPPVRARTASASVPRVVAARSSGAEVTKQRRWALAAAILILGGGAASACAARARGRSR